MAERLNTAEAYRQFLGLYPDGRFSELARTALRGLPPGKAMQPVPVQPQTRGIAAPSTTFSSGLQASASVALSGDSRSSAVTATPGETYIGPGPITVGYLGARKQVILPNGPWVLLASLDRNSMHAAPVPLVTMVFGQFRDGKLAALMNFLFTGRKVSGKPTWSDAEACHRELPHPNTRLVQVSASGAHGCGWTVRQVRALQVQDVGWEAAQAAADRLGAPVPQSPVQFTRAWVVDGAGNYLAIRRADYLQDEDPAKVQAARSAWLHDYLPLMLDGFNKKIAAAELESDQPKLPGARVALPD
jgi:hypothetical protein